MTREQDLERRLADWLEAGPVVAPSDVVDEAIERTRDRKQRRAWWSWLFRLGDRLGGGRRARRLGLPLVVALTLLAALAVSLPFAGGPGPAPEMDANAVRVVGGSSQAIAESPAGTLTERTIKIDADDPRVRGEARQSLLIEDAVEGGVQRFMGPMRLENPWGAWEGAVNGVRYPDGTEIEYGWLAGENAYEGFSYFHSTRGTTAETERAIEGAIWPGEPPPMPDPSLLQADPLG